MKKQKYDEGKALEPNRDKEKNEARDVLTTASTLLPKALSEYTTIIIGA